MKIKDIKRIPKHMTTIGGQAVIEGVMMKGPKDIAIAIRKPDNEIEIKKEKIDNIASRNKLFKLPFIRGIVGLVEAMIVGTKTLMYSAEFYEEDIEDESESFFEKVFKDKSETAEIIFSLLFSLLIVIVVFMAGPMFLTSLVKKTVKSPIVLNLIEGLIRIIFFLIYVIIISKIEDVGRVFEYHGAEHKTIHCYENEEELTVENVKKYPILHPRCGTSFLFMVMIVSVLVLSLFGWPNPVKRFLIRLLMLPIIAGISYEINKIIGRSNGIFAYILSYPGLMLQKIATVREPDDEQIEVAIEALKGVLVKDKEDDLWK
ncbi:DUF1385 domain-containing protein [Anaerosalibacter massiliensis]|uniref:DUF1385 domain-containing protein n=1 Tax=Anaerosalibacter massiliensis TaxID=1347392 RepID=A0A9X2MGK4_9FIRM|nr:DUF1385 domain-containing protein [Anaerosalibacter massiliensis]MCR2044677.1 DUF1385 domain-containing protein [Anaerosalibacter massiliensis]